MYPGHRISVGGDLSWRRLSDLYSNFILPFKVPKLGNQVEASTSLHLLPYILFILPFIVKKTKIKENIFGFTMLAYSILLFFYTVIGLPEIIARISLFSFVTSGRAWQSLAVIGVFVSIWFIGYVWDSQIISEKRPLVFLSLIITLFLAFITINQAEYRNYIGNKYILMISLAIFILIIAILYKKKVILILTLLPLIVGSGMTVNPVVKGLSAVESKSLTFKIKEIVHRKPQGVWISEGSLYNYPQMFGAKTLNSVRFYPDIKLMRLLDPNNKKQNIWNRYAHMQVFLTKDKTNMQAPVPDVLNIQLSTEELSRLNVNYVLTHRNLQEEFGDSFQRVYGPDLDGNSIYHYKQK
ncbi:hypothetical protein N1496_01590 [Streptococcus didelphis]|uniref:Uncharacterized protein n=1 Tax=Streptococcus didelphis TaxID=102886 RepID=A0ABY9LHN5_9STRE|nr:hypothetical protein [Streptococcus didelphis]WMB28353.1 hypothetical protein N1496_01590 [Streptococcus didelphis]